MSRSIPNSIKTGDLVTVRGLPRSGVGIVIRLFVRDLSYGAGGVDAIRYLVADVMWARGDRTEMMVDNLALMEGSDTDM